MSAYDVARQKSISSYLNESSTEKECEWSPDDTTHIQPRPIIVCERCRRPYDIQRETYLEHFNGLRCRSCGKQNPSSNVLCDREPIENVSVAYGRRDLYIVEASSGEVKIGVSKHPEKRLEQLQTACPFDIELVTTFSAENAGQLEAEIHNRLSDYRKTGEWFVLDDRELSELVASVGLIVARR